MVKNNEVITSFLGSASELLNTSRQFDDIYRQIISVNRKNSINSSSNDFFVHFVVLLLPRGVLLDYQIVAGGNNKIFGDNKNCIL